MSDFYMRQGDTATDVVDVLRDAAGNPVDIAGAAVRFTMTPLRGGDAKVDDDAAMLQVGDGSDGSKGRVKYAWENAAQTDTPGDYLAVWKVTYAGGKVLSFPNSGYLLLTVTPKPGAALSYVGVEELKKTLKLTTLTFADLDIEVAIIAAARGLDAEYGGPWYQGAPGEQRFYTPIAGATLAIDTVDDVTEVAVDQAGAGAYDRVLVDGTDYRLEPVGAGPYDTLRFLRSGFAWYWGSCGWSTSRSPYPFGIDGLRITGTFGHESAPEGVKAATTIIAARVVRRMREAPFGGAIGFGLEGAVVRASQLARDPEVSFVMKGARGRRRLVV